MPGRPHAGEGGALTLALSSASIAGGLFLPLSLVYFTVLTDISLTSLGALVTAAGLVAVPLPVLAGWLVDRLGARPLVVAALVVQAAGYLGFVVAREPVAVFAASACLAVGGRLFWSSIFALVAEHAEAHPGTPVEAWFARINTVRTVGIVAGGLVAGFVVSLDSPRAYVVLAWAAAAGYAVAAVLVLKTRTSPAPLVAPPSAAVGYGRLLRDRAFLTLLAANTVFALSTLFAGLTLPTLIRSGLHGPGWLTAALLVTNAVLVAVFGPRGGLLAARRPARQLLRAAAALWCLAFLVLALGAATPLPGAAVLLLLSMAALSGAEVLHAPASTSLVNAMAGPHGRGRYLATLQYSFVAAELVGPVMFATLFEHASALPYAVLAVANAAVLPFLRRTSERRV